MNRQQIKKWSLLRHLNFKGYKRTASGNPLNMIKTMSISKLTLFGNATQSRLPDGYTEVAYIETSGSQSVSTGIYPTNLTTVEGKFEINESGNQYVYGCKDIDSDNEIKHGFYISYASGSHFASPCFGAANLRHIVGNSSSTSNILLNTPYSFKVGQDGCYLNDVQIFTFDDTTFSTNTNEAMFVGGLNDGGLELETAFKGKIYSFKVYEDGELIQSLVPCRRDIDDKVGMYDIISDQFLIGGGIGSLVTGDDIVPSPDAPVEVQLCGDKTGNLLDVTKTSAYNIEVKDNEIYLSDYSCATSISPEAFLKMTGLSIGDTITATHNTKVINGTGNGALGRVVFLNRVTTGTSLTLTSNTPVTIPEDFNSSNYYGLYLYGANQADENGKKLAVMSDFAIYKGSYTADTLPAYEPYGYKVSGRVEGLNLLDYNIMYPGIALTQTGFFYGELKLLPNTQYTLSTNVPMRNNLADIFIISGRAETVSTPLNGVSINNPRTVTTDENGYLRVTRRLDPAITIDRFQDGTFWLMLVQGSYTDETMPPYEPYQPPQEFAVYLPEQIAKVGDVADEVVVDMEKRTAELRKNILQYEHSDNWTLGANGKNDVTQRFYQASNSYLVLNSRVISNVFAELNPSSSNIFNNDTEGFNCSNNNYLQVRVNKSRLDTVDVSGFKSWLAAYEETTPLIIYGEALTPVTTDITSLQQWDAMPQVSGSVTIKFNSTIPISSAETEYYSKEYDAI